MANIIKKNINTIILSIKSLIAEKSDVSIILSALMLEIVLSGLNTLRTLKEFNLLFVPPEDSLGSQAVITIIKSNIFQGSYI